MYGLKTGYKFICIYWVVQYLQHYGNDIVQMRDGPGHQNSNELTISLTAIVLHTLSTNKYF
jgi:hypothetical protein